MRVFTHQNEISDAWRHASRRHQLSVVVCVQQADTPMMEVFHQQHDLITFSVVGEVN